ncbi:hypothetical protein QLX67_06035 [Balneolaceae bacterium ANBcel3]|nr:hypothetical protein [Balneolaceae bacterium ANBcel3]
MQRIPSDFVAKMAHDLKTPVGNAMMYTELMSEDLKSMAEEHPDVKEELETLLQYCSNIHLSSSKLIYAIQSWGYAFQIDDGVFQPRETTLDLKQMLTDVLERNRLFTRIKRISVSLEYNAEATAFEADKEIMNLVFENLMSLFINMSPTGSEIRISVAEEDNGLMFRFEVPPAAFNPKLVALYSDDIKLENHMAPDQGILKPGGYCLIFTNMALRYMESRHGVDEEGSESRSFWFHLPLS